MEWPWSGGGGTPWEWLAGQRERFAAWRRPRPLAGGTLLVVAGLLIGYVPAQFAPELLLIGGTQTIIGLFFAALVSFCGVGAIARPRLSSVFGVFGGMFATMSLIGALGGLFVGTALGTAGGVLCYAWEPPADAWYEEATFADASEFIWAGTGEFIWQTDHRSEDDAQAGEETTGEVTDPVTDGDWGEGGR